MKKDRYDLALGRERVEPPMPLPPIDSRYCNPRGTIPDDVLKKAFNEERKSDRSLGVEEIFFTPTEGWGHQPLFTVHAAINHVTDDVKREALHRIREWVDGRLASLEPTEAPPVDDDMADFFSSLES